MHSGNLQCIRSASDSQGGNRLRIPETFILGSGNRLGEKNGPSERCPINRLWIEDLLTQSDQMGIVFKREAGSLP